MLASSAKEDEVDAYLDLLDARGLADAWTTSADVRVHKPVPDLVHAAVSRVDADRSEAIMVGDTPWTKAALGADVPTLTVMTGGFSDAELREAGSRGGVSVGRRAEETGSTKRRCGDRPIRSRPRPSATRPRPSGWIATPSSCARSTSCGSPAPASRRCSRLLLVVGLTPAGSRSTASSAPSTSSPCS